MAENPYQTPKADVHQPFFNAEGVLELKYQAGYWQLVAWQMQHQFLMPVAQILSLIFPVLLLHDDIQSGVSIGVAVLTALLFYLFVWCVQLVILLLSVRGKSKNALLLAPQTIRIYSKEFYQENELGRSYIKWKAVQRFSNFLNGYAVYLSQHNAVFIPKNAFLGEEHRQIFIDAVKGKLKS